MARIYTDIKARDFLNHHKKITLEIWTDNDGKVISIHPEKKEEKK